MKFKAVAWFIIWSAATVEHRIFAEEDNSEFSCDLCGGGLEVTIPDGVVSISSIEVAGLPQNLTCNEILLAAEIGVIGEEDCLSLVPEAFDTCGCSPIAIPANNQTGEEDTESTEAPQLTSDNSNNTTETSEPTSQTDAPVTSSPTVKPTPQPVIPSGTGPTILPTSAPTNSSTDLTTNSTTSSPTNSTTSSPTESPTKAPTTSPSVSPTESPSCYNDFHLIRDMEADVEDVSEVRTYNICPDMEYPLGTVDVNFPGVYVGGYEPIEPRPNVHYICGDNRSLDNNCVLKGGDFAVIFLEHDTIPNVVFQGFTFEGQGRGTLVFTRPGSFTCIDCHFKNIQNLAPILASRFYSRRLQGRELLDITGDYVLGSPIVEGDNHRTNFRLARGLDEEVNDADEGHLDLTFQRSIFENILPLPPTSLSRSGIITLNNLTSLVLDTVEFIDNDFGGSEQPSGYAVQTYGSLNITNSCFTNNDFKRLAPVIKIGTKELVAVNNFGTPDAGADDDDGEDLVCSFIANFENDDDIQLKEGYVCYDYDAPRCSTDELTPEPTPLPTLSPTDIPVQQPVAVPSETPQPISEIESSTTEFPTTENMITESPQSSDTEASMASRFNAFELFASVLYLVHLML